MLIWENGSGQQRNGNMLFPNEPVRHGHVNEQSNLFQVEIDY